MKGVNLKFLVVGISLFAIITFSTLGLLDRQANADSASAKIPTVSSNKVVKDTFTISIPQITFLSGSGQVKRMVSIPLVITNNNGPDMSFLPKGQLLGITGTSGNFYDVSSIGSLDENYISTQEIRKSKVEKQGKKYEPGVYNLEIRLLVDGNEQGFGSILYQDENGTKVEIPIVGTPVVTLKSTSQGR